MSAHYTELRAPWSSLRVEDNGQHARITLWADGKCAGTLTVGSDERSAALWSITGMSDGCISEWGCNATVVSAKDGPVLHIRQRPRSRNVVSDMGEVIDWDELIVGYPLADGRVLTHADFWSPPS